MGQLPNCKFMGFDGNGDPLNGGKIYFYTAGTSTPKNTYSDPALTSANANPVVLDSRGEADIYGSGLYKVIMKTSADVTIWTVDNFRPTSIVALSDTDDDTKIQVEEASDEDIIRFDINGTEQLTLQDGKLEPTTTNDIDLGSASKLFKILYGKNFHDGTYTVDLPTNGMANAKIMLGDSNTIAWFYLNAAPPGWKVTNTGADTILGVNATALSSGTADTDTASHLVDSAADFVTDGVAINDVAYNITDDTSAKVTAVAATDLTLDSDVFPLGTESYEVGPGFMDPGGNQADKGTWTVGAVHTHTGPSHTHQWYKTTATGVSDQTYDSAGDLTAIVESATTKTAGSGIDYVLCTDSLADEGLADSYTSNAGTGATGSTGVGTTATGKWRPASSIGKLYQLDTA